MDIWQILVLGLVQGVTEFLPISSSAHLILASEVLGWPDQGVAFDISVHLGTLVAVLFYFRKDLIPLTTGWIASMGGKQSQQGRLAWQVVLATVPAVIFGLFAKDFIENQARSVPIIAATTLIFGVLLWYADAKGSKQKSIEAMGIQIALIIGIAQAVALIPGTSRSGITITAALLLGLQSRDAARFSFLLAIPLILAASSLSIVELVKDQQLANLKDMAIGFVVSAISAFVCIQLFIAWVTKAGMIPFVLYRLLLGLFLLVYYFL